MTGRWFRMAALALAVVAQTAATAQALSPAYVAGRQARLDGRLDDAQRLLAGVVAASPNDYLALYNYGLVFEARSRQSPAGVLRVTALRTAATWLEKALAAMPASGTRDFTIYNTLGYVYLQLGDLTNAEARFAAGLQHADQLSPESAGKLQGNLGYVRALRGDTPGAIKYFDQAAKLGNVNAANNLQTLRTRH